jgi:hypothetical protein
MDDRLFEELLQEIDAMTTAEYWSLYREAEKLADFPPEDTSFIPVQFKTSPVINSSHYFNDNFDDRETVFISHDGCQSTSWYGDDVWPTAA